MRILSHVAPCDAQVTSLAEAKAAALVQRLSLKSGLLITADQVRPDRIAHVGPFRKHFPSASPVQAPADLAFSLRRVSLKSLHSRWYYAWGRWSCTKESSVRNQSRRQRPASSSAATEGRPPAQWVRLYLFFTTATIAASRLCEPFWLAAFSSCAQRRPAPSIRRNSLPRLRRSNPGDKPSHWRGGLVA